MSEIPIMSRQQPLGPALSHLRILERPPLPPALLIEEEQIAGLVMPEMPAAEAIPASSFIDVNQHVHIEYNNGAFDPAAMKKHLWRWFWDPERYYRDIAPNVIAGSLLKDERQLIGGATFHYYPQKNEVYVQFWGIYSPKQARERGIDPAVLKEAAYHHHEVMDRFHRHLGIKLMTTTSGVEACERRLMQFGWEEYKGTWKKRLKLFKAMFPISLRGREKLFRKFYP